MRFRPCQGPVTRNPIISDTFLWYPPISGWTLADTLKYPAWTIHAGWDLDTVYFLMVTQPKDWKMGWLLLDNWTGWSLTSSQFSLFIACHGSHGSMNRGPTGDCFSLQFLPKKICVSHWGPPLVKMTLIYTRMWIWFKRQTQTKGCKASPGALRPLGLNHVMLFAVYPHVSSSSLAKWHFLLLGHMVQWTDDQ